MYTELEENITKKIVQNLRKIRKENKHSQNVFAEKVGYQREYVAKVETCKRNLTLKYLIRTSIAYKIPLSDIL